MLHKTISSVNYVKSLAKIAHKQFGVVMTYFVADQISEFLNIVTLKLSISIDKHYGENYTLANLKNVISLCVPEKFVKIVDQKRPQSNLELLNLQTCNFDVEFSKYLTKLLGCLACELIELSSQKIGNRIDKKHPTRIVTADLVNAVNDDGDLVLLIRKFSVEFQKGKNSLKLLEILNKLDVYDSNVYDSNKWDYDAKKLLVILTNMPVKTNILANLKVWKYDDIIAEKVLKQNPKTEDQAIKLVKEELQKYLIQKSQTEAEKNNRKVMSTDLLYALEYNDDEKYNNMTRFMFPLEKLFAVRKNNLWAVYWDHIAIWNRNTES